jgi:hypothetical protein
MSTRMKGGGWQVHHGRILHAVITPKPGIAVFKTGMGAGLPKKVDKLYIVNIIWRGLPAEGEDAVTIFTKRSDAYGFFKEHVGMTPSQQKAQSFKGIEAAEAYDGSDVYEMAPDKLIDEMKSLRAARGGGPGS